MNNKEGKEEPWKRGKVEPEKRTKKEGPTASPSLHPQSGAQVGFLKMSAEGVGSRVIRAKNFGLRPSLLTTGLGSRKEYGFG